MAVPEPSASPTPRSPPLHVPREPIVVVLDGSVGPGDVPRLARAVRGALGAGAARHVACDLGRLRRADIGTVDALSRLALIVRRHGCRISLQHASAELRDLLWLAGLAGVLPLETGGEAEEREEPGRVEEEGDAGDAAV